MDLRSKRRTLITESRNPTTGLTACELGLALAEFNSELEGLVVRDVTRLADCDDLLIFLGDQHSSRTLHLVPGSARGRICPTTRRWPRAAFRSGPQIDCLTQLLRGTSFRGGIQAPGERRCRLCFSDSERSLALELELFGNRGFWAVTDADGKMLVLSRLAKRAGKSIQPGSLYQAPPAGKPCVPDPVPRFAAATLDSIDRYFTAQDLQQETRSEHRKLELAVARGLKKLRAQVQGLDRQRQTMRGFADLRRNADLLLAYGFSQAAAATELRVEDPSEPGSEVVIPLQPGQSIQKQADRLYQKARKHQDGLPRCEARIEALAPQIERLEAMADSLQQQASVDLAGLHAALVSLRLLPEHKRKDPTRAKLRKLTKGENFRQALTSEGYRILIGRNNRQNDRLSKSIARGNDLWFHVGRGQVGSHVVLRLPKGKTASLESLLDAATLAIHFSKSRGTQIGEVIYTQAKFVSKPRGLAPGRVLADHTKSLRVDLEPERLSRLLNSADQDPSQQ